MQKEEMNLVKTPLMDYVNTTALEFITGKRDLDKDWDAYVKTVKTKAARNTQTKQTKFIRIQKTFLNN